MSTRLSSLNRGVLGSVHCRLSEMPYTFEFSQCECYMLQQSSSPGCLVIITPSVTSALFSTASSWGDSCRSGRESMPTIPSDGPVWVSSQMQVSMYALIFSALYLANPNRSAVMLETGALFVISCRLLVTAAAKPSSGAAVSQVRPVALRMMV